MSFIVRILKNKQYVGCSLNVENILFVCNFDEDHFLNMLKFDQMTTSG